MPELAPAPTPTASQVVIQNVEHLHIHVGPEAIEGLSHLMANSWVLEGSAIGTQIQEPHPQGRTVRYEGGETLGLPDLTTEG